MEGVIQNDQYFNIGRLCNLEKADVFHTDAEALSNIECRAKRENVRQCAE